MPKILCSFLKHYISLEPTYIWGCINYIVSLEIHHSTIPVHGDFIDLIHYIDIFVLKPLFYIPSFICPKEINALIIPYVI